MSKFKHLVFILLVATGFAQATGVNYFLVNDDNKSLTILAVNSSFESETLKHGLCIHLPQLVGFELVITDDAGKVYPKYFMLKDDCAFRKGVDIILISV